MSLTREDLHLGLHRFATKHDLDRFATKQELAALREDSANGFEATRRHIDCVAEELAVKIQDMLIRFCARNGDASQPPSGPAIISPLRGQSE